jgi:ATP-citrate lyase alpha-subunit
MTQPMFTKETQCIFWNNNRKAVQRMLDYDFICQRKKPSVAGIVHPTGQTTFQKFFFGEREVLIPVYASTQKAAAKHPQADVLLNFASFRTAYDVTVDSLRFDSIKTIMITAEGIPERLTRLMNYKAKKAGKTVIGPSTVGAIAPGVFKIGNIGGSLNNIVRSKLRRKGCVGLVTRSGGLFNEMCNIISRRTSGIVEGVAVGGDRYPGTTFIDHLLRMDKYPEVKFHVLLGEVGGTDEYDVIEAVKNGLITKPIIAWCIGTVAKELSKGVQFGHAGAKANSDREQADDKNKAMREAGITVPETFNTFPEVIKDTYVKILQMEQDSYDESEDEETIDFPEDYADAFKAGKIRKETNFICTISDDRGEEAVYAGVPISKVALPDTGYSIGDVISLLWFKKRYPKWATDFIETVVKTVADHGPAVSGAHNARVTARAGKDVVTSLTTGLLTIGPRFGGAIDGAAKYFKHGFDNNLTPKGFLDYMKLQGVPIPGIGHRVKSVKNPDLRVSELKRFARENFPKAELLNYALEIEKKTTGKKGNLILNVDGAIGVLMVDLWRCLNYSDIEINQYIDGGTLNALFIVGRSIGFVGHILDEKRLNMPMYRHDTGDVLYDVSLAKEIA